MFAHAEFTDSRCIAMLDHVTVYAEGKMVYDILIEGKISMRERHGLKSVLDAGGMD